MADFDDTARVLSDLLDKIDRAGEEIEMLVDKIAQERRVPVDHRFLAAARIDFEKSFMVLRRAVTRRKGY